MQSTATNRLDTTLDQARRTNLAIALALRHFNMGNWSDQSSSLYYLKDVYVGLVLGEDNKRERTVGLEALTHSLKRLPDATFGIIGDQFEAVCRS